MTPTPDETGAVQLLLFTMNALLSALAYSIENFSKSVGKRTQLIA